MSATHVGIGSTNIAYSHLGPTVRTVPFGGAEPLREEHGRNSIESSRRNSERPRMLERGILNAYRDQCCVQPSRMRSDVRGFACSSKLCSA